MQSFHGYHHDIKPRNLLIRGADFILADFGLSRLKPEDEPTQTNWKDSTYEYGAPECRDPHTFRPGIIGRALDIWSLGCVFLEFSIWLLHGPETIKKFAGARGTGRSSTDGSRPLYQVTDKATKAAKVHQLVIWTIKCLQDDPRCKGDTALAALLNLIKDHMLQPEVKKRYWAADVGKELEEIIWKAKERDSYLFNSCDNLDIPSPNFEHFQSVQD